MILAHFGLNLNTARDLHFLYHIIHKRGAYFDGIDGTQWKFPFSCVSYTHHIRVLLSTLWRRGMARIFTSKAQVSNLRGVLYPNPGFRQEKVQSGARAGTLYIFLNQ